MRFSLPRRLEVKLQSRLQEALPGETCGLLLGTRSSGLWEIRAQVPSRNLAPPAQPGRGGRFRLDPVVQLQAERRALAGGIEVIGCYHSHPGGQVRPSILDLQGIPRSWIQAILLPGGPARVWSVGAGMEPVPLQRTEVSSDQGSR